MDQLISVCYSLICICIYGVLFTELEIWPVQWLTLACAVGLVELSAASLVETLQN